MREQNFYSAYGVNTFPYLSQNSENTWSKSILYRQ